MAIPKNLRLKFKVPKSYVHPKPKINSSPAIRNFGPCAPLFY
jgi:hypothetical protein